MRLSLELLETFVALADNDGDATHAAEVLKINQPSISKRLATLRRLTSERMGQPWLLRKGKRWRLTSEGQRVRLVVADMMQRYEHMERFIASGAESRPIVAIACGQQAAGGVVRSAVEQFLRDAPDARVRVSTPRGRARIKGVAAGQFDLAIVTDSSPTILKVARREMYIEELLEDHFVLAANPSASADWGRRWKNLADNRPVRAADLLELPFALPEPGSSRRKQFDDWCFRATQRTLNVRIEVGGWQAILDFVEAGHGVGLVPRSAIEVFKDRRRCKLTVRSLDPAELPPDAVRLIARKAHGKDEPDLTEHGMTMLASLRHQAASHSSA
jgi:DNA-binding transcriptional LysR family regulator